VKLGAARKPRLCRLGRHSWCPNGYEGPYCRRCGREQEPCADGVVGNHWMSGQADAEYWEGRALRAEQREPAATKPQAWLNDPQARLREQRAAEPAAAVLATSAVDRRES
jgi:hypothetical protein